MYVFILAKKNILWHSVQTSFENRLLLLKMDLDLENYTITKFDNLKSKNELLGLCCNSGSLIAQEGFPQEIWLKIFSYLKGYSLKELGLLDSVWILQIRPSIFKEVFRRFLAHFLIL